MGEVQGCYIGAVGSEICGHIFTQFGAVRQVYRLQLATVFCQFLSYRKKKRFNIFIHHIYLFANLVV